MNSIKNLKNGGIPRPYSRLNWVKDLEANYKHSQNEEELKEVRPVYQTTPNWRF